MAVGEEVKVLAIPAEEQALVKQVRENREAVLREEVKVPAAPAAVRELVNRARARGLVVLKEEGQEVKATAVPVEGPEAGGATQGEVQAPAAPAQERESVNRARANLAAVLREEVKALAVLVGPAEVGAKELESTGMAPAGGAAVTPAALRAVRRLSGNLRRAVDGQPRQQV